jgi:hypothetical protein
MATQDDLFAKDDIKRIVEKAKSTKMPILGTNVKLIKDTAQQIENVEGPNVRPTASIKNIQNLSDVERPMGHKGEFHVKGVESPGRVSKITIGNKTVIVPRLDNYKSFESYNNALKKFRVNVLQPLLLQNPEAARVLTSGAYLEQFAADQRKAVVNDSKLRKLYNVEWDTKKGRWKIPQASINEINRQMGYIFETPEPRSGLPKGGKVQSKMYQMIQSFWKKNSSLLNKETKALKNVNFKLALQEIDKMFNAAKTVAQKKKAVAALTSFLTLISTNAFGKVVLGAASKLGALNYILPFQVISDALLPTDFLGSKKEAEEKKQKASGIDFPGAEGFNRGGLMDINHMTRPLGYALGTQAGELVGDRERDVKIFQGPDGYQYLVNPDGTVERIPGQELQAEEVEERSKIFEGADGYQYMLRPEGTVERIPGQEDEEELPYDRDKGYTENLNELMSDIGGTLKEKVKGAGSSLLDKINDFIKYGWGDREDYMEIGGEQVDPEDPNFRRFIEENYMGEGESYIEGIENYRREAEGNNYRRGGIVSINSMTRTL